MARGPWWATVHGVTKSQTTATTLYVHTVLIILILPSLTHTHTHTHTQSLLCPFLCFERLPSMDHIVWIPLLSGFSFDLVSGWHHQGPAEWKEDGGQGIYPSPCFTALLAVTALEDGSSCWGAPPPSPHTLSRSLPPLTPLCKARQLPTVSSPWVNHDPC